jgi:general secretion pathway protein I
MKRQPRGFTLLEVLIALAIVTMSVAALLGAVTSSASNILYLKDKTFAEWVALNRITEIRTAEQMPDVGKRSGSAEMGGQKWQWEEEVAELPIKGLFRIDVRVRSLGEAPNTPNVPADASRGTQVTTTNSTTTGSDLKNASWMTTATGVVGSAQSTRRQAIAAPMGDLNAGGGPGGKPGDSLHDDSNNPNNPGGPKSPPGQPPVKPPGNPSE